MSSVAPLPSGVGVSAIADHRPHHDPDQHYPNDQHTPHEQPPHDEFVTAHRHRDHAAPAADDATVPAETLFAATLLGGALRRVPSAQEIRLRARRGWTPPDSTLRLKDKLI